MRDDIRKPKWDIVAGIPSLKGKVAIVTGANSDRGIGYHIAKALAEKGAKVYIGARTVEKVDSAIDTMKHLVDHTLLHPFIIDLADPSKVRAAASSFRAKETRLDILVNNAAVLARPLDTTEWGISLSIATNHLGPFLLTQELIPVLEDTARISPGVRVVTISSSTHTLVPNGVRVKTVEDLNQDFGGSDDMQSNMIRYGFSKLANILFTKELQRRIDSKGSAIVAVCLHPGGVKTDGAIALVGGEDSSLLESAFSVDEGALTPIFAAAHPSIWTEKQRYGGAYLMPFGAVEDVSENGKNMKLAEDLWKVSEEAIKV